MGRNLQQGKLMQDIASTATRRITDFFILLPVEVWIVTRSRPYNFQVNPAILQKLPPLLNICLLICLRCFCKNNGVVRWGFCLAGYLSPAVAFGPKKKRKKNYCILSIVSSSISMPPKAHGGGVSESNSISSGFTFRRFACAINALGVMIPWARSCNMFFCSCKLSKNMQR